MTNRPLKFSYYLHGYRGTCFGVSVSQATDRAKNDYLRVFLGVDLSSPLFKVQKTKLKDAPIKLELAKEHYERHRFLYRSFKDGDCTEAEVQELEFLIKIIRSL
jgi:hypothetical protein